MNLSSVGMVFLLSGFGIGQAPANPKIVLQQNLDITYAKVSKRQKLDVFRPSGSEKLPIVLFVHGGAWFMGDKDFFGVHRSVAKSIANKGFVVIAANYRLSPDVKHPAHVEDVAKALAWIFANPTVHGGDVSKVSLVGHSAGAHLVTLLATDSDLWDKNGGPKASDRASVCGVVGLCGVYRIPGGNQIKNLAEQIGLARQIAGITGPGGKTFNPFKIAFGEDEAICRKASPVNHAKKGLPPFLLLVAERDLPGLGFMAGEFEGALVKSGVPCRNRTIPSTNHISLLGEINRPSSLTATELNDFLQEVSRHRISNP